MEVGGFLVENSAEHSEMVSVDFLCNGRGKCDGVRAIENDGLQNLGVYCELPVVWDSGESEKGLEDFEDTGGLG